VGPKDAGHLTTNFAELAVEVKHGLGESHDEGSCGCLPGHVRGLPAGGFDGGPAEPAGGFDGGPAEPAGGFDGGPAEPAGAADSARFSHPVSRAAPSWRIAVGV
jgi:hypothetical protein